MTIIKRSDLSRPLSRTELDNNFQTLSDGIDALAAGTPIYAAGGGTVDVITATLTPTITAYTNGLQVHIRASGANTSTTPTLNIDSVGAKTIVKLGNQALLAGDIPRANYEMILRYNSTNDKFELLNPSLEDILASAATGKGDSLITGKRGEASAQQYLLHGYHEARSLNFQVDYGADNTGATDNAARWDDFINDVNGRAGIVPRGAYKIATAPVNQIAGNCEIIGHGMNRTAIYAPITSGFSLFDLNDGADANISYFALKNMTISGADPSATTVGVSTIPAINCRNLDHSRFEDLSLNYFNAGSGTIDTLAGSGIKWNEGFNNVFKNIRGFKTRILFDLTDGAAALDGDLLHFEDIFDNMSDLGGIGTTFRIKGRHTRVTVDGKNIFDNKGYGVYWVDPAQTTASLYGWEFNGVHCEASNVASTGITGFHIDIGNTGGGALPYIGFNNCWIGIDYPEAYDLRGVRYVDMISGGYAGNTGAHTFITAAANVEPIILKNVFYDTNAVIDIAAPEIVRRRTNTGSDSLRVWDDSDNATHKFSNSIITSKVDVTYSTSMSIDARQGNVQHIDVTDSVAFTIGNPTGGDFGQELVLIIENSVGGAMGTITWGSNYRFEGTSDPTTPTSNKYLKLTFHLIGSLWIGSKAENIWT